MAATLHRKDFLKQALLANIAVFGKGFSAIARNFLDDDNKNVAYYKPGDAEYETLRKGFNKRIDKHPAVIALCKNMQGIQEAVLYAKNNKLPVTVKSGGHCMEGFSCNNNGMVINLSLLRNIEWIDNNTVKIQPACTLAELYATLLPKKKLIPGGSCAGVAIGGLTLGGGYGLMSRRFGLTCDSLTAITMIDGNGTLVNSADDPALLWACKGGGNGNFGIIGELKFNVHDAPATLQSVRFRSYKTTVERARTILAQWFSLTPSLPPSCFSAFVMNGKTAYILLTNSDSNNATVDAFINTMSSLSDNTSKTPPRELAVALKAYYGQTQPLYFKNASAGLYKSFADISPFIDSVLMAVMNTPGMIYQVNTLGGNIQNNTFAQASCFPHRDRIFFSELQAYWEDPKRENKLVTEFQAIQNLFKAHGISAQYRNYPDINFDNWQTQYYGDNYAKLQQMKNTYDPQNLFNSEQSIRNA